MPAPIPTALTPLTLRALDPMLLVERPVAPDDESHWLVELKHDGYRVLAEFGEGSCSMRTRQGADCTRWFPEVARALSERLCGRTVIDGEMCVLDEQGRSDFDALHARARRRRWTPGDPPVTYCAFDLLIWRGRSVMAQPLVKRKARLQKLVVDPIAHVICVGHVDASDTDRPVTWLYAQVLALQLEGVVAKRPDSRYLTGQRSDDWRKIKRPGAVPPGRFSRSADPAKKGFR